MSVFKRSDTMNTALIAFDVDGLHRGRLLRPFDALVWMQALDATLARLSAQDGHASSCFSATEKGEVVAPAPHTLLLLPISHDARHARVDHVLVHAPGGFDERAVKALNRLRRIERHGDAIVTVVLVDIGDSSEFLDKVEHFGTSKVWQNITTFVPFGDGQSPGLQGIEHQVRAELALRGLPACSKVEVSIERGHFLSITAFQEALLRGEVSNELQPAWDAMQLDTPESKSARAAYLFGLRLRFDELVRGPIALGQWAHYGMGQFLPG